MDTALRNKSAVQTVTSGSPSAAHKVSLPSKTKEQTPTLTDVGIPES